MGHPRGGSDGRDGGKQAREEAEAAAEAQQLVDFLAGKEFQQEVALNLFVWPARTDVAPPAEFATYATVVADPLTVAPADIAANREAWVDAWTDLVLR